MQASESSDGQWDSAAIGREPSPEFVAEVADQVGLLMDDLGDESLRTVATMKMEGCTNAEVARHSVVLNGQSNVSCKSSAQSGRRKQIDGGGQVLGRGCRSEYRHCV